MAEPVLAASGAPRRRWDLTPKELNVVAFTLLFLITLPMLTKIFTSDYGTHLALGRHIVDTWRINDKEFLNYTSLGIPNANHSWGFQVILYLVYRAGGNYGVSLMLWAMVFCILLLLHRSAVIRGANPLLTVLALFAFAGFLRLRIQPRPEIFTYLFIALSIYLFSEYFFGMKKKVLFLYPILMFVWGNIHGSYLIGLVIGGVFFLDALARAAWNRRLRPEELKKWILPPVAVGVLGLVACGLNPLGYDSLMGPLVLLSRGTSGGGALNPVFSSISELTPVKGTGMFVYYKAAMGFALVALLLGAIGRRIYFLDILLFAVAFKGAWDSARAVSMMGLFLSPGASVLLTGFLVRVEEWIGQKPSVSKLLAKDEKKARGRGTSRDHGRRVREARNKAVSGSVGGPWTRRILAGAISLALIIFGAITISFSFGQLEYGIGMTEHKFSFAATEFLRKNPVHGNMFNFFDVGGFLDWQLYPQALTFIDGRAINQQVFMEHQVVTGAMPGWKDVLNKYRVTYVVTKAMDSSGMILPLVPALANDKEWSLVFSDGLFVVFVRNTPETQAYVSKFAIPNTILPKHIIWEAHHYMYLGVSPVVAYSTMSNMYEMMGDRAASIEVLRKALAESEEPYLRNRLMQLEGGSVSPGRR
jgi:hypothetical protein